MTARLSVLAMVASLLVIGAAPASAAIDTSSSCPASIPAAGFTDIATFDAATQSAINCIASYGISKGTSATTFSPDQGVSRWQMALFLTRQATAHGVSLPSGAPQGFTDIAGFDAATQTAINQLAQLGISKGTSATTFSPLAVVSRWQMALFLTRLVAAAGVTLPSGAPQGFTDLAGLSSEATTAVNQVKQVGIADGTSATTYAPFNDVLRWQMALFLTRTLAADGITPTQLRVSVTPADSATLNAGQARTFTATFKNPDGSAYTGRVGLELLDTTSAGAPIYNDKAENVYFQTSTDSLVVGPGVFEMNGFPGTNGTVTFTIRNNGTAERVRVVAWQDTDANDGYSTGNNAPTEPFALGGVSDFAAVAAGDAASGTYNGMTVSSTTQASDVFEASNGAVNCGNGVGSVCSFHYDSNDIFAIGASATDLAGFEGALSETDVLNIIYSASVAGQSTFTIATNNVAPLTVTDPSAAKSVDAATYTIKGTGDPAGAIKVKVDLNNDGDAADPGEGTVASGTTDADGAWSVVVSLTQDAANNFVVTQTPAGGSESAPVDVPTITEGANQAAKITSTVGANGGTGSVLDPGDTIVITFNEEVGGVGSGDTISLLDVDGSTATLTCGTNVTCSLNGAGTVLTVTVTNVVATSGGTTGGIQSPTDITAVSGFQGVDGLAINVTGSGAGRTFTH